MQLHSVVHGTWVHGELMCKLALSLARGNQLQACRWHHLPGCEAFLTRRTGCSRLGQALRANASLLRSRRLRRPHMGEGSPQCADAAFRSLQAPVLTLPPGVSAHDRPDAWCSSEAAGKLVRAWLNSSICGPVDRTASQTRARYKD